MRFGGHLSLGNIAEQIGLSCRGFGRSKSMLSAHVQGGCSFPLEPLAEDPSRHGRLTFALSEASLKLTALVTRAASREPS